LLEFLSVAGAEQLEFHLKDRLSPGILKGAGKQNHTYVIMPMRI
jgi:DNA polymerase III sliding clamp (beta) subunit (PCNA family)